MLLQLSCHLRAPGTLYSNVCHNLFAIDSIWATNNSSLAHRRVAQERFLNFARRNSFTAALNYLAQTAPDKQVAILIQVSQVTSPKPSILKCLLPGIVLVRANHAGSGNTDFACFSWPGIAYQLPTRISSGI